jgi:hypothetical protein
MTNPIEAVKTMTTIHNDTGSELLIYVLAERAGYAAALFEMNSEERQTLRAALIKDFETALDKEGVR